MKIKKLEFFFIKNKNKKKSNFPRPSFFQSGIYVIKLVDFYGNHGLGEPSPYCGSPQEVRLILKKIFVFIYLQKIENIDLNLIHKNLLKINKNSFCLSSCLAAISQCILDLKGKYKENNSALVLNPNLKKNEIKIYASGGMLYEDQSTKFLIEEALKYKSYNYFGYKFRPLYSHNFQSHQNRFKKPPPIDIYKTIEIAKNLRKEVGNTFHLMIDLGCRCKNLREAKYIIDALSDLNFYFIEEPFQRKINNYKKIKNRKLRNIAAGEHIYKHEDFFKWADNNLIDFVQLDTNSLDLVFIKNAFNFLKKIKIKFVPHNWTNLINTAATVNLLRSIEEDHIMELNIFENYFHQLFRNNFFKINNGSSIFFKSHGLGVFFIEKNLKYFDYLRKEIQ